MKKFGIPLLAVCLALLVLAGALLWLFLTLPKLGKQAEQTQTLAPKALEEYLKETWPDYRLVGCADGVLTLEYDLPAGYETLQKHGLSAGYDAVAAGHLDTAALMIQGADMQCGVVLSEVVVLGISSDGQEVYRASTVDGVTACWDE